MNQANQTVDIHTLIRLIISIIVIYPRLTMLSLLSCSFIITSLWLPDFTLGGLSLAEFDFIGVKTAYAQEKEISYVVLSKDSSKVFINTNGNNSIISPTIVTSYQDTPIKALRASQQQKVTKTKLDRWSVSTSNKVIESIKVIGPAKWTVKIEVKDTHPQVAISAKVDYLDETYVGVEALEIEIPNHKAHVIDRSIKAVKIPNEMVIDRWTPQIIWYEEHQKRFTLIGHAQSLESKLQGNRIRLRYELDNALNHPLKPFDNCWDKYNHKQESQRQDRSAFRVGPYTKNAMKRIIELELGLLEPIYPMRFPQGYNAALIFTDHADQSSAERLEALMYGSSNAEEQGGKLRGFAGNGLSMTKSIFTTHHHHGSYFPQLSNKKYKAIVERLLEDQIEIGPHSVSGYEDSLEETKAGLNELRTLAGSSVWIDHQPSTNCEALANPKGSSTIKLLKSYGYRYAWATLDLELAKKDLNMFNLSKHRARSPILYHHANLDDSKQLWLFPSVWSVFSFEKFIDRYKSRTLSRLIEEHGIHIAHVYLDTFRKKGRLASKSLIEESPMGGLRLKEKSERMFRLFAKKQAKGELLVSGIAKVADHLRAMQNIEIEYTKTDIIITNKGKSMIKDATFFSYNLPEASVGLLEASDSMITNSRCKLDSHRKGYVFWIDLYPNKPFRIHFLDENNKKTHILSSYYINSESIYRGQN